jgi:uncharacterized protein (DUF849 family)
MPFATQSALMGGSVRVGLVDSLYIAKGKLAESNAQQVEKIRSILETLASPWHSMTKSVDAAVKGDELLRVLGRRLVQLSQ